MNRPAEFFQRIFPDGQKDTMSTERFRQFINQQTVSRDQQLFTDPQLLRSLRSNLDGSMKYSASVREFRENTPEKRNVVEERPYEAKVENANQRQTASFYYEEPRTRPVQRTYVVGGGIERPHSHTIYLQPPPVTIRRPVAPSILQQATFRPVTNLLPSSSGQIIQRSQSARKIPNTPSHSQMISKTEYQRCVKQCRMWEEKYKTLQSKKSKRNDMSVDEELNQLRAENYEMEERLIRYQRNQANLNEELERRVVGLMSQYKEAMLKECLMLFQRFKLETRQVDKGNDQVL